MSTRDVLLDSHDLEHLHSWQMRRGGISSRACGALLGDPRFSSQRADGWMELELGDFHNGEGDDGELEWMFFLKLFHQSCMLSYCLPLLTGGASAFFFFKQKDDENEKLGARLLLPRVSDQE